MTAALNAHPSFSKYQLELLQDYSLSSSISNPPYKIRFLLPSSLDRLYILLFQSRANCFAFYVFHYLTITDIPHVTSKDISNTVINDCQEREYIWRGKDSKEGLRSSCNTDKLTILNMVRVSYMSLVHTQKNYRLPKTFGLLHII